VWALFEDECALAKYRHLKPFATTIMAKLQVKTASHPAEYFLVHRRRRHGYGHYASQAFGSKHRIRSKSKK